MSEESVRRKLEAEYGRIPDDAWEALGQFAGAIQSSEDEELFEASAREVLNIMRMCGEGKAAHSQKSFRARPGRKPGWSGYYSLAFDKRYNLYLFLVCERAKVAFAQLNGEDPQPPETWQGLYERYKARVSSYPRSFTDSLGRRCAYVPPTVDAFEKACLRALKEFDELTDEDRADWDLSASLCCIYDQADGWRQTHTASDSFQAIRDKRSGLNPNWRQETEAFLSAWRSAMFGHADESKEEKTP